MSENNGLYLNLWILRQEDRFCQENQIAFSRVNSEDALQHTLLYDK